MTTSAADNNESFTSCNESAKEAVERRILLLKSVHESEDGWRNVTLGGDAENYCTKFESFEIRQRSKFLCCAFHADIFSTLRAAPDVLSHVLLYHVNSHQDETTEFDHLPFKEQLNVLCDRMATAQLTRQTTAHPSEQTQSRSLRSRHLPVEVFMGTQNIPSHYIPLLGDEIISRRHRDFLQKSISGVVIQWLTLPGSLSHYVATGSATITRRLDQSWFTTG